MPKIVNAHHSRYVPTFGNLPKEMRVQFMRNRIFYLIEATEEDIEDDVPVQDTFDDINAAVHRHSTGLFNMHTTLINPDGKVVDYDDVEPEDRAYLQVVILFELEEDRKRFMRDYLVLQKLST
jgi:hypothetical protein